MFLDTRPADLDDLHGTDPWAEFRVTNQNEIALHLRKLVEGSVPFNLSGPGGASLTTLLWAMDASRGVMSFAIDGLTPEIDKLIVADEAVAVAYQESVKFQFNVSSLMLVRGAQSSALQCRIPEAIYRFQRRSAYRVRTPERGAPVMRMRHPAKADLVLAMRVLDISIGGCAMLMPPEAPPVKEGIEIRGVRLDLDADTRFVTTVEVRRVAELNGDDGQRIGWRIGTQWVRLDGAAERALQLYIDGLQKKRRMMMMR
jgi:c-di-GMP-binding flagellar brake protein YcgR